MRQWFEKFFYGRQGMDDLSKTLFWSGLGCFALSILTADILGGVFSGIFSYFSIFQIILSFIRAFSRQLQKREAENGQFLRWKAGKKNQLAAYKDRRSQSKDFKFFKCPGCGTYLRVPKGKGKIHIKCKCGYTLYRKT